VGRIVYNAQYTFLEDEHSINTQYLQAFADCGSAVVLHAHEPYSIGNIVEAHLTLFRWSWERDVDALVDMLIDNPACMVTMESSDLDSTGGYEKGQVLRQEVYALPLVPFAHRLELATFLVPVRNFRICEWAKQAFPSAHVFWTNPARLAYGSYFGEIDSEDTEDEEEDENADEEE
jgi:hypothetical protein